MKGYRFYEELENKGRKGEKSLGNVVAALLQPRGRGWDFISIPGSVPGVKYGRTWKVECVSALFAEPNSPVCGSQVTTEYPWERCRRVSESRAREVHPKLFEYLD